MIYSSATRAMRLMAVLAACILLGGHPAGRSAHADEPAPAVDPLKYQVVLDEDIESAKMLLVSALEARNYVIINVLNVQEALDGRGIDTHPIQIVEFCNLVKAYRVTRTTPEFELFAPCRFALFEKDGRTLVMAMRPSFIGASLPADTQTDEARDALRKFDDDVREILEALARGDM
ncbi:MAG: DUF302 domain-containing protein [Pseudomonadota bacterium]